MPALNYKHLRYFWTVARLGSAARAAEALHLSAHAISGQLRQFEAALGVQLIERRGCRLVLTDTGHRLLEYADEIFALGDEALDMLRRPDARQARRFAIGVTDSVPKSVATQLLRAVLQLDQPPRLECREGRLAALLAELSIHRLEAVVADRPMPPEMSVRAYSHLLGASPLAAFCAPALHARLRGDFPALLDGAPCLLPGEDVAFRTPLLRWLADRRLAPRIVAECDDMALLKALGREGEGVFVAPHALADTICRQYGVVCLGQIAEVTAQIFLISTERRIAHPAMRAMQDAARLTLFGDETAPRRRRSDRDA